MVIPSDTRSPDSAGSRKINIVMATRKKHGTRIFNMTYSNFRSKNIWNVIFGYGIPGYTCKSKEIMCRYIILCKYVLNVFLAQS